MDSKQIEALRRHERLVEGSDPRAGNVKALKSRLYRCFENAMEGASTAALHGAISPRRANEIGEAFGKAYSTACKILAKEAEK